MSDLSIVVLYIISMLMEQGKYEIIVGLLRKLQSNEVKEAERQLKEYVGDPSFF